MLESITCFFGELFSPGGEYTGFFGIDFWQLLFTWGNLLILFLIIKHFLYQPVKKMLADRQSEVEETYRAAEEAKTSALAMQAEYEAHLKNAKEEAGELVRSATKKAQLRGEEIIAEAHQKSAGILKKAEEQIENEKKKAVNEIKNDISDMAFLVAGQVVEKELDTKEHQRLIESFIDDIDDLQMSDRQS